MAKRTLITDSPEEDKRPAPGAPPDSGSVPGDSDETVARLAEGYVRAGDALVDWITTIEARFGGSASQRPEHAGHYETLCAAQRHAACALARARPATVRGLVLKLRAVCACDDLRTVAQLEGDEAIILSFLHDLESLAEAGSARPSSSR